MASAKSPGTSRKSPKASPKPPRVDRRQAVLAAKKKKEANTKAQKIVEELIDGTDDKVYFLTQLRWINQSHYQDIVEERTIIKLCGYPLCGQSLGPIPKQKYHISTTENKVYDITERKNFCSNDCYKASLYLKNQLSTSPLWLRDKEPVPNYSLYHNSTIVTIEDINFGIESIRISDEKDINGSNPSPEEPSCSNSSNMKNGISNRNDS